MCNPILPCINVISMIMEVNCFFSVYPLKKATKIMRDHLSLLWKSEIRDFRDNKLDPYISFSQWFSLLPTLNECRELIRYAFEKSLLWQQITTSRCIHPLIIFYLQLIALDWWWYFKMSNTTYFTMVITHLHKWCIKLKTPQGKNVFTNT